MDQGYKTTTDRETKHQARSKEPLQLHAKTSGMLVTQHHTERHYFCMCSPINIPHSSLNVSSLIDPGNLYLPSQHHCSPTLPSGCSYNLDDECTIFMQCCGLGFRILPCVFKKTQPAFLFCCFQVLTFWPSSFSSSHHQFFPSPVIQGV